MKIHILGICGTFMGGLALVARSMGHEVCGTDKNVYPPMSEQLANSGIKLFEGYEPENLLPHPDLVVIGNTLSRGNACVEYVLDKKLAYTSGAQFLAENVLLKRHVMAVSGTHGKTTTSSILAWILESANKNPGFLIGGIAENFGISARTGESEYFVVEADEYDTAFFDKRSKFIHYRPSTLVINNIEFDHADIFSGISDIRREFHHLIRTLPGNGLIIAKDDDKEIDQVINMGCWTPVIRFGVNRGQWIVEPNLADYSSFKIKRNKKLYGVVNWDLIGRHNAENALAAIIAADSIGITSEVISEALKEFKSVKRRLQKVGCVNGITVYDDFAHHPTAIRSTINALRQSFGDKRIIIIIEPRSNTMKMGIHKEELAAALGDADMVYFYHPGDIKWNVSENLNSLGSRCYVSTSVDEIINTVVKNKKPGDHIAIMSNGGFENIHDRLLGALEN